jgi:hypothetical protein
VEIEDRINAIEAELRQTKDELNEILGDIRSYLSEIPNPIPSDVIREKHKGKRG